MNFISIITYRSGKMGHWHTVSYHDITYIHSVARKWLFKKTHSFSFNLFCCFSLRRTPDTVSTFWVSKSFELTEETTGLTTLKTRRWLCGILCEISPTNQSPLTFICFWFWLPYWQLSISSYEAGSVNSPLYLHKQILLSQAFSLAILFCRASTIS